MNQGTENQVSINLVVWIRENWVWAAPLIYIYVTVVGMVQSWLQFNAFGINVFEFSELNDFLLAAFREPLSFLAILGLIVYGGLGIFTQRIMQRIMLRTLFRNKSPEHIESTRRLLKWFIYSTFVTIVLIAPYYGPRLLHQQYGQEWKDRFASEPNRNVTALIKNLENNGKDSGWIKNLTLIGTTDKFIFFIERSTNDVLIAPISNVVLVKKLKVSNKANAADAKSRAAD
jgi:hypothetical protein